MGKMHTRAKRKLGLTTTLSHKKNNRVLGKVHGPKTFKTEEAARKWAAEHKLDTGIYTLIPAKRRKKFKIAMK
jgi:hypothetical protein